MQLQTLSVCNPSHPAFPTYLLQQVTPSKHHPTSPHIAMDQPSTYLRLLDERTPDNSKMNCYVCVQAVQRKPELKQEGPSKTCLLCNNPYCQKHKGKDEGVCEIGHVNYYENPENRARHSPVEIFPSLEARKEKMAHTWLGP